MPDWLAGLNAELIAGGIAGISLLGVIIRNAILGYVEARSKLRSVEQSASPLTTAVAVTWDRNQIERFLQMMERIAEAQEIQIKYAESIAKAQGVLADQFQQTTHMKLNELLEKLDDMPQPNTRVTRPGRR